MKYRKILVTILAVVFLGVQSTTLVLAAPDIPDTPDTTEEAPETPDNAPTPTPVPSASAAPTPEPSVTPEPVSTESPTPTPTPSASATPAPVASNEPDIPDTPLVPGEEEITGDQNLDGSVGGAEIDTGDAEATGAIINTGNDNVSAGGSGYGDDSVSIVNDGNGSDSSNSGAVLIVDDSDTNQTNNAELDNSLVLSTDSGQNSASSNVGGDNEIDTGDANTSGSIFNSVNTNIDGLYMSEFNIVDDHVGDYILDYGANCTLGCDGGISISNTDNGTGSTNTGVVDIIDDSTTFQQNDALLDNELILSANSGDNETMNNVGGDNYIYTGDANVSGSVVNFANTNIAGNVIYGVVNIFGDVIGDIIIPEDYLAQLGIYDVSVDNTGNGSGSVNNGDIDLATIDNFDQFNNADLTNLVMIDATTGDNNTSSNTGGDNSIQTGSASVDAEIVNLANTNLIGQDIWIVLVNQAGSWYGQIIGGPDSLLSDFFALSGGNNLYAQEQDALNITNADNGSGSVNNGDINVLDSETIDQQNNAQITNNIVLDANTGGNSASRNTAGDNTIVTGDANIILNLVNFVNTNIIGGNVLLTVFNIFGDFDGDIITPGADPIAGPVDPIDPGIGGPPSVPNPPSDPSDPGPSNGGGGGSDGGGSSDNGGSSTTSPSTSTEVAVLSFGNGIGGSVLADADTSAINALAATGSDKVKINLAWLLLLLPGYFVVMLVRRTGIIALLASRVSR